MSQKTDTLERSILDLGTQLFQIKTEFQNMKCTQNHLLDVMKGLKLLLDEKGVINIDDFENAIDLVKINQETSYQGPSDHFLESEIDKIKKNSH